MGGNSQLTSASLAISALPHTGGNLAHMPVDTLNMYPSSIRPSKQLPPGDALAPAWSALSVSVTYHCITNSPKLSNVKQQSFLILISHSLGFD